MQVPPNMGTQYAYSFKAIFYELAAKNKMALVPFLFKNVGGVPSLNQKMAYIQRLKVQKLLVTMFGRY